MTDKCNYCVHSSVCKYKEKYLQAVKDFQETKYEFPIKIKIECHQYLKDNECYHISIDSNIVSIGGKIVNGL